MFKMGSGKSAGVQFHKEYVEKEKPDPLTIQVQSGEERDYQTFCVFKTKKEMTKEGAEGAEEGINLIKIVLGELKNADNTVVFYPYPREDDTRDKTVLPFPVNGRRLQHMLQKMEEEEEVDGGTGEGTIVNGSMSSLVPSKERSKGRITPTKNGSV